MRLWMTSLILLLGGFMAEDCSESNMKFLENNMNNCIQDIAMKASSELHNSSDPVSISHTMCSTQATIYSNCVQPMDKCFSHEYVSWLVEPVKNILHEIAIAKVGTQYDQECREYHIQDNKATNYSKDEYGEAVDYDYTEKYHEKYEQNDDYTPKQHDENHEHDFSIQEVMDENKRRLCHSYDIYDKMGNCSHDAVLKVHHDIQDVTDPNELNKIACHALNIISTNCAEGVKKCLIEADANSYINIQVEQWKSHMIAQIEERAAIKMSLDNCHHLNVEYTEKDLKRKENDFNDYYKESYKDTYKEARTEAYSESQEYNSSLNQEDKHCSPSKKQIAENQMDNCYQSVATNAYTSIYNLTDPGLISDTICAIQPSIEYDCVKYLRECFSQEYIQWLVRPMKKYLYDLAAKKLGIKFVIRCSEPDHHDDYNNFGLEPEHQNSLAYNGTTQSNEQNMKHQALATSTTTQINLNQENEHCSPSKKEIAENQTDYCYQLAATNAFTSIYNITDPGLISDTICGIQPSIEYDCGKHLKECFSQEYIQWLVEPMKKYLQDIATKKFDIKFVVNCSQPDHHDDNDHYGIEQGPQTPLVYHGTTESNELNSEHQALTTSTTTQNNLNQENEHCSPSKKEIAENQTHNCYQTVATIAFTSIYNLTDPDLISDTICAIQTSIEYDCGKHLKECFSQEYIQWLFEAMKKYLQDLATKKFDIKFVVNCSQPDHHDDYDHSGLEQGHQTPLVYHDTTESNEQNSDHQALPTSTTTQNNLNQRNEHCSPSKKEIAENQTDNCYQSVATNAFTSIYDLTDPGLISDTICGLQTSIEYDCGKHLKECFSQEYIKLLVEPMKKYLHDLAAKNFGIKFVVNCSHPDHHDSGLEPVHQNPLVYHGTTESNEENSEHHAIPTSTTTQNNLNQENEHMTKIWLRSKYYVTLFTRILGSFVL